MAEERDLFLLYYVFEDADDPPSESLRQLATRLLKRLLVPVAQLKYIQQALSAFRARTKASESAMKYLIQKTCPILKNHQQNRALMVAVVLGLETMESRNLGSSSV